MKQHFQNNGLAIANNKANNGGGSYNRGGYRAFQYAGNRKSPYVNKAGNRNQSSGLRVAGASNTDSELYSGPGGL